MNSRRSALRSLIPTALILTALIALFFAAGSLTRAYVLRAVNASDRLGTIREETSRALELQLDEETGIRGYAATSDPDFLEPYVKAKAGLTKALNDLQDDLAKLDVAEAAPRIARARADSADWAKRVAIPTLHDPRLGAEKVQRIGKKLMDAFRSEVEGIQRDLETRQNLSDEQLRRAVDRITLLVIVAALILSGIAIAYAFEQVQASERVAEKERLAEEERRQRAELQGAYDAERRIAERLQTAFSQRPLPQMAPLRFSASYVPATEETRLGGDWYDVFVLSESRILFTIGDVTGHGIDAAVTMNRARQAFVSAARRGRRPRNVARPGQCRHGRGRGPLGHGDCRRRRFEVVRIHLCGCGTSAAGSARARPSAAFPRLRLAAARRLHGLTTRAAASKRCPARR